MYQKRKWKDVLTIISGKNQKAVETVDGKYPIYGSGGIIGHASSFLCPAKTVIVGRKGTIDRPIYVEEPFWNIDTAFGVVAGEELLPPAGSRSGFSPDRRRRREAASNLPADPVYPNRIY